MILRLSREDWFRALWSTDTGVDGHGMGAKGGQRWEWGQQHTPIKQTIRIKHS